VWPELCIATVIKHVKHNRVVEITRKMTLGTLEHAQQLLQATGGGSELNTSFIERFNGTMRERLASLTRKCRHAAHRLETIEVGMYLLGCTYNFCWPHHELSSSTHRGHPCTPAMAAGQVQRLDMVDNSSSLCNPPLGWFFRHEAVRTGDLTLE
jgi:hypothetical protein